MRRSCLSVLRIPLGLTSATSLGTGQTKCFCCRARARASCRTYWLLSSSWAASTAPSPYLPRSGRQLSYAPLLDLLIYRRRWLKELGPVLAETATIRHNHVHHYLRGAHGFDLEAPSSGHSSLPWAVLGGPSAFRVRNGKVRVVFGRLGTRLNLRLHLDNAGLKLFGTSPLQFDDLLLAQDNLNQFVLRQLLKLLASRVSHNCHSCCNGGCECRLQYSRQSRARKVLPLS